MISYNINKNKQFYSSTGIIKVESLKKLLTENIILSVGSKFLLTESLSSLVTLVHKDINVFIFSFDFIKRFDTELKIEEILKESFNDRELFPDNIQEEIYSLFVPNEKELLSMSYFSIYQKNLIKGEIRHIGDEKSIYSTTWHLDNTDDIKCDNNKITVISPIGTVTEKIRPYVAGIPIFFKVKI